MTNNKKRSEEEVFTDLTHLCSKPGFIHAIAHISLRDNIVIYENEIKPEDLAQYHSPSRLLRTEISTLIGLLIKSHNIDVTLPEPTEFESMVKSADSLLAEIHRSITPNIFEGITPENIKFPVT